MKQFRTMSLIEAVTNLVVGYLLAVATHLVAFQGFGIEAALSEHPAIDLAFVATSLAGSYLLRRLFGRSGRDRLGQPSGIFRGRPDTRW